MEAVPGARCASNFLLSPVISVCEGGEHAVCEGRGMRGGGYAVCAGRGMRGGGYDTNGET